MLSELAVYKKAIFTAFLAIICAVLFFEFCASTKNYLAIYLQDDDAVEKKAIAAVNNERPHLDSLVTYNVNDVSKVLLRIFNNETTIMHYGSSKKTKTEYAAFFSHTVSFQGKYEDIIRKIYQLEQKYPNLFIVNLKIKQNIDSRKNESKTKKTNDLGAEITVVHCSF